MKGNRKTLWKKGRMAADGNSLVIINKFFRIKTIKTTKKQEDFEITLTKKRISYYNRFREWEGDLYLEKAVSRTA
jgi:hypothetical protein